MNTREAILATADHIERHPSEFDFDSVDVPDGPSCGTPACAIGWICHFKGMTEDQYNFDEAVECGSVEFYSRMDEMSGGARRTDDGGYTYGQWRADAAICVRTLRAYLDKYHPVAA